MGPGKASAALSAIFMTAVSLVYALPVCGPYFQHAYGSNT